MWWIPGPCRQFGKPYGGPWPPMEKAKRERDACHMGLP